MRTGETCERTGHYCSTCCDRMLPLMGGESFPICKNCKQVAKWMLIRPSQQPHLQPHVNGQEA